jgi:hypothetical protein
VGVRVNFDQREKFRLLGPNQLEVVVSIHFSEIEKALIATYDLRHFVIIERMPTIFKDFNDEWREIDNNIYLGRFLRGTHAEPVTSPKHAKVFEQEMLLALETLESYFNQRMLRYCTAARSNETRFLNFASRTLAINAALARRSHLLMSFPAGRTPLFRI